MARGQGVLVVPARARRNPVTSPAAIGTDLDLWLAEPPVVSA